MYIYIWSSVDNYHIIYLWPLYINLFYHSSLNCTKIALFIAMQMKKISFWNDYNKFQFSGRAIGWRLLPRIVGTQSCLEQLKYRLMLWTGLTNPRSGIMPCTDPSMLKKTLLLVRQLPLSRLGVLHLELFCFHFCAGVI